MLSGNSSAPAAPTFGTGDRNPVDFGIKGKRALICGASRGLGFAAASALAREGAHVALVARSEAGLAHAADCIRAQTGEIAEVFAVDLTLRDGRAALMAANPATDILVTHAGVSQRYERFQQLKYEDWIWWMNAHFFAAIELIQAYVPGMMQRRFGRIVNISVNFIKYPQIGVGHSHAARLALAGSIASLAREVAPYNVTINSILPGPFQTDALKAALTQRADKRKITYEAAEAEMLKSVPAARVAEPHEAGDLIVMLSSNQMGFVTGQNICIDGGQCPALF
jgi:3-oxoacyl-[acyl-carrier protein] reductase